MAKRLVIDYGTDTLIDLDAPRQNLEQRFNLGGLVRQPFFTGSQQHTAAAIKNLEKGAAGRKLWNVSQKEDVYEKIAKAMKKVEETGDWEYLLTKFRKAGDRTHGAKKGMLDHSKQLTDILDDPYGIKYISQYLNITPDEVLDIIDETREFSQSDMRTPERWTKRKNDYAKAEKWIMKNAKNYDDPVKMKKAFIKAIGKNNSFLTSMGQQPLFSPKFRVEMLGGKEMKMSKSLVDNIFGTAIYNLNPKVNKEITDLLLEFAEGPKDTRYEARQFWKDNPILKRFGLDQKIHGPISRAIADKIGKVVYADIQNFRNPRMDTIKHVRWLANTVDKKYKEAFNIAADAMEDAQKNLWPSAKKKLKIMDKINYEHKIPQSFIDAGYADEIEYIKVQPTLRSFNEMKFRTFDKPMRQLMNKWEKAETKLAKKQLVEEMQELKNKWSKKNGGYLDEITISDKGGKLKFSSAEGIIDANTDFSKKLADSIKQTNESSLLKKALNVGKGVGKYAGKTAIKLAAPFVPFLGPAAVTLGALDVKEAHARGLTKPQELGTAYYLGPTAAQGMRDITEYDYKGKAGEEWESIKESWANRGTGTEENVEVKDYAMFKGGGSVEPRVEYREGTRMSPATPKEKTYEELLREIQMEYNIPTDEGYMVKDKLGRLGDIVDIRNYPYYLNKAGRGIMEAAEFSVRFPGAAGQFIHDAAQIPTSLEGWKQVGSDFMENVSPGWGWSEKVGLDSLIDEQVGNMKKRGSSDAPTSLGGLVELGTDIAMPLGYLYGAKKVGQFMNTMAKTPEKVSALNKRIMDHLDASGQSRRDFITMAGTMGTFAALKAMGLDKVLKIGPAIKGTDNLIPMVKGTSQMPEWFPLFIQKIEPKLIYEGDGISTFKGTDDFLPGMEITKTGDDYVITGKNEYDGNWSVSYEGPRWLEIEPGQKPTYFSGEFQVADEAPYMVGPDDYDWDIVTHDTIDDILGGNGRSMEEFAKGTKIEGLTKGEKQVDWAEGRFQSEMDMANEDY